MSFHKGIEEEQNREQSPYSSLAKSFHSTLFLPVRATDASGRIYFSELFNIAGEAFETLLREELDQIPSTKEGEVPPLPIVQAKGEYFAPIGFGDPLHIFLQVIAIGTSSFTLREEFYKYPMFSSTKGHSSEETFLRPHSNKLQEEEIKTKGEHVACTSITHVFAPLGNSTPLPEELRVVLQKYLHEDPSPQQV